MIVIAKDTERKLLEELYRCKTDKRLQKCFYMAFSRESLPKRELFENFLRLLQDVPNSYVAQVYVCNDTDVFILMQGFMQRHFSDFTQKLSGALGVENLQHICEIFEIGIHFEELENMCLKKKEQADAARAQDVQSKSKEEVQHKVMEILSEIDPALVAQIPSRRTNRAEPLVMVVDDDQLSRTLAGNALSVEYNLCYARNGREALVEYPSYAPDVVFLDIGMPDVSGHDVLECLFQMDPEAYVIMFSGRKDKENIMRALEAGAQGFIGKPFTRDILLQHAVKSPFLSMRDGAARNTDKIMFS